MLNQIKIAITLRLSQVQCLTDPDAEKEGAWPQVADGLDDYLVFSNKRLGELMSRITELHTEKADVKVSHRQLHKDFTVRKKKITVVQKDIEELMVKFIDIQKLKFGQVVDLDVIERYSDTKHLDELEKKVEEAQDVATKEAKEWDKKIEAQKTVVAKEVAKNTELLEEITKLGYQQMYLDTVLNSRISNVTINDDVNLELKMREEERLRELLERQATEIQTLQAEIHLFRKKGGHIYTTVTSNRQGS